MTLALPGTIDHYLAALRKQLRGLTDEDARDIVEEIRAHILDKTCADPSPEALENTLAALGAPETLALRYRTEELMRRAQASRSPGTVLRDSLRRGFISFSGLIVFMLSAAGYGIGAFLIWLGLTKAVHPKKTSVDLEFNSHTWSASFQSGGPPHGHDPFGLWLIPFSLVVGTAILWLSFRFSSWGLRKLRGPGRHVAVVPADE